MILMMKMSQNESIKIELCQERRKSIKIVLSQREKELHRCMIEKVKMNELLKVKRRDIKKDKR